MLFFAKKKMKRHLMEAKNYFFERFPILEPVPNFGNQFQILGTDSQIRERSLRESVNALRAESGRKLRGSVKFGGLFKLGLIVFFSKITEFLEVFWEPVTNFGNQCFGNRSARRRCGPLNLSYRKCDEKVRTLWHPKPFL